MSVSACRRTCVFRRMGVLAYGRVGVRGVSACSGPDLSSVVGTTKEEGPWELSPGCLGGCFLRVRSEGPPERTRPYADTPIRRHADTAPPLSSAFRFYLPALSNHSSALASNGLMRRRCVLSLVVQQRPMKTKKVPRERNPFLLSGKRRWRLFRWIWGRTRRDGATNNLLSQAARPA